MKVEIVSLVNNCVIANVKVPTNGRVPMIGERISKDRQLYAVVAVVWPLVGICDEGQCRLYVEGTDNLKPGEYR